MQELNKAAWDILNSDEQLALTLKHGHGKSSWEAGEIMGKAHYKFLEIEGRAKQILKMFTEHLEFYHEIIPDFLPIDKRVKRYFKETIEKRRTIKEAVDIINDGLFEMTSGRDKLIIEAMEKLNESEDVTIRNVALLIFDFDRWNNFRILPIAIQEPSAFKRRNKNADKKNIRNITTMHTLIVEELIIRYHRPQIADKEKVVYIAVFSKFVKPKDSILTVRRDDDNIVAFNKLGIYVFAKLEKAKEFYDVVSSYNIDAPLDCKFGQKFWPMFRVLIKQSLNYNAIQKRMPSRKFLESALDDLDLKIVNRMKKKANPEVDDYNPKPLKKRGKKKKESNQID